MYSVLWITNMPTIYRVNFFNELGKYCNLTVMFERYNATGVKNKWKDSLAVNFRAVFHKTIDVGREGAFGIGLLKIDYRQYDNVIISSYSSPAEILALCKLKMQRIPYILEVDGGIIKNEKIYKKNLKKFLISGAGLYFSSSDKTSEYLKYYGAETAKICKYHFTSLFDSDVLESTIDSEEKKKIRIDLGLNSDKMVLAVGQFIYRKGFDILLKAVSKIPSDVDVVIIGGMITEEYSLLVHELNLKNVHFISEISKKKLNDYYKAADIFVLPTREDIWGLVINEAMAKGLPVITTDQCVAGLELIANSQNGYIIQSENEAQLAEKINFLLENQSVCLEIGSRNLARIRSYTFEQMAKEHFEVLYRRNCDG